jgi:hypothetical protein
MAVRFPVVMIHAPPRTAHAERTAAAVVGELIGQSGLDLTLVGPLDQLSESSADRLSLGSLVGDVAVLDWQSPSNTVAALHRIGFSGQRSRHAHDPSVPVAPTDLRRIYAFDLTKWSRPRDLMKALSDLKSSCQVRTFTLGATSNSASPSATGRANSTPTQAAESSQPRSGDRGTASPPEAVDSPEAPCSLDLDDLVDQLDRLDP